MQSDLDFHELVQKNKIFVATIRNVPKGGLERYCVQLVKRWSSWGDNGGKSVLLIVATEDKKAYIEAGYGLDIALTQEISEDIINKDIMPKIKRGDIEGGIETGIEKIIEAITYKRGYEGLNA